MKKLLFLILTVSLTLSMVVAVSAATFTTTLGGRIAWDYFTGDDAVKNDHIFLDNSGLKMQLKETVSDEATGTWGAIGAKLDGWANGNVDTQTTSVHNIYDFGINKFLGSNFNIWYTNWENENAKRGQDRIRDIALGKYNEDHVFDNTIYNSINIDYNSEYFVVNLGYVPDKGSMTNSEQDGLTDLAQAVISQLDAVADADIIAKIKADDSNYKHKDVTTYDKYNISTGSFTYKFEGGSDIYAGYFSKGNGDLESTVGGDFKVGSITFKADYLNLNPKADGKDSVSQTQVAAYFDAIKLDIAVLLDDKYTFGVDGGTGWQIRYNGLLDGKFTIAYRGLNAEDDADQLTKNLTDFYIGYKYGIFETRLGAGTIGKGNSKQDIVYASVYASFW